MDTCVAKDGNLYFYILELSTSPRKTERASLLRSMRILLSEGEDDGAGGGVGAGPAEAARGGGGGGALHVALEFLRASVGGEVAFKAFLAAAVGGHGGAPEGIKAGEVGAGEAVVGSGAAAGGGIDGAVPAVGAGDFRIAQAEVGVGELLAGAVADDGVIPGGIHMVPPAAELHEVPGMRPPCTAGDHAGGYAGYLKHDAEGGAVGLAAAGAAAQDIRNIAAALGLVAGAEHQCIVQGECLLHIAHAGAQALPHALLQLLQQLLLRGAEDGAEGGIAQGGAQAHVVPVFEGEGNLPGLHEGGGAAAGVFAPGAFADELAPLALQLAFQAKVDGVLRGSGPAGKGGIQLGLGVHHGLGCFLDAGFFRQGHTGHRPRRGALHQQQARQQQRYETAQHGCSARDGLTPPRHRPGARP